MTIVTGDSVLTACHVAREVGIITETEGPGSWNEEGVKKKDKKEGKEREGQTKRKAKRRGGKHADTSGKKPLLLTVSQGEVRVELQLVVASHECQGGAELADLMSSHDMTWDGMGCDGMEWR